ncbi:hypothetical protein ACLB2K_033397 [Fragaria x ananassa]
MEKDPIVLKYKDVRLRESDLDLLIGPHYLNDCIIQFYFSHLSSVCNKDILLVSPTISFFLANSPDSDTFRGFAESNQFGEKQVVIFTVNDSQDMSEYDGGNHWSLLVYYRKSNAFVHYDSLGGLNSLVARKFYGAIKKHVAAAAARQTPKSSVTRSTIGRMYYSKHRSRRVRNYHHHKNKNKKKTISGAFVMMGRSLLNKFYQLIQYHPMKKTISGAWNKTSSALQNYYLVNTNNGDHDEDISSTSDKDHDDDNDPWFREESAMPQQTNLYDCGLYVMFVARVICQWYCVDQEEQQQQQQHCSLLGDERFPNIISYVKRLDNNLENSMRPGFLSFIQGLIHDQTLTCNSIPSSY